MNVHQGITQSFKSELSAWKILTKKKRHAGAGGDWYRGWWLYNDSWSPRQLLQDGVQHHIFSYDNAMTLRQFESRLERYGIHRNTADSGGRKTTMINTPTTINQKTILHLPSSTSLRFICLIAAWSRIIIVTSTSMLNAVESWGSVILTEIKRKNVKCNCLISKGVTVWLWAHCTEVQIE
jgi:hypothetical protein